MNNNEQTNHLVRSKVNFLAGPQERLLAAVQRRKLAWFGHVTRHDSLSKTILQGTMEGWQRRGRQRKWWMDNIKEWTHLPMPAVLTMTHRKHWKRISAELSLMSTRQPNRLRNGTENVNVRGESRSQQTANCQFTLSFVIAKHHVNSGPRILRWLATDHLKDSQTDR